MSPSITPYKVSVPDSALTSLKSKLSASIFPAEVDFSDNWESGTPLSDVKRLAKYWHDGFDWRAQEKQINETLPQFMTKVDIDGFGELDMHFVHKKSSKAESIPLLFCHGCMSFYPIILLVFEAVLTIFRAWKLPRSFEDPAPPDREHRWTIIPRRRSISPQLRLLPARLQPRVRANPIRRSNPQSNAQPWLLQIRYLSPPCSNP